MLRAVVCMCVASAACASPTGSPRMTIGVQMDGLPISLSRVGVTSANTYDYTFTRAPCDWISRGGGWAPFPRWVCDPRWTWYGGGSHCVAATWNRKLFAGDIAVTAYVAFSDWDPDGWGVPFNKSPNDLNLTLCGDGANLDSGYSFMLGADLNSRTCIMKRGRVIAETTDRAALLPRFEDDWQARRVSHKRWWDVRAERIGQMVRLLVDNKLVLEANDEAPLREGRIAIWTLDNSLIVSRVRIDYETELQASASDGGARRVADARP